MSRSAPAIALASNLVLAGSVSAQSLSIPDSVGLRDLVERIGAADVPTGAGVVVGMVEAFPAGTSDYHPGVSGRRLVDKTFITASGPSGRSGHATRVACNMCGTGWHRPSIAPGISTIHLYSAEGWIGDDFLRAAQADTLPRPSPDDLRIFNNSWIGTFPDGPAPVQSVLRRADQVVERDGVLVISGVNNAVEAEDNVPLMSHMYNGLAVGRPSGRHQFDATRDDIDGPGRMKPEIVAPGDPDCCTSFSTAVVSAAAALLVETATTAPSLHGDPQAVRPEVIKAVLLAGAEHRPGWTNHADADGSTRGVTDRPIDPIFGVDMLDVNASHRILTGGHHLSSSTPPARGRVRAAGWSLAEVPAGDSVYYLMVLPQGITEASIVATWNRQVEAPYDDASWETADVDLFLWRVDEEGELASLVGDEGRKWFAGGNIVSESPVDNLEHLYVTGLRAGSYVLEVRRQDVTAGEPVWDVAVAWRLPRPPAHLLADVNGDGAVDALDLASILIEWDRCDGCTEDVNGDGIVGTADIVEATQRLTD